MLTFTHTCSPQANPPKHPQRHLAMPKPHCSLLSTLRSCMGAAASASPCWHAVTMLGQPDHSWHIMSVPRLQHQTLKHDSANPVTNHNHPDAFAIARMRRVSHNMHIHCQAQGAYCNRRCTFHKTARIADKDKVQPDTPTGWAATLPASQLAFHWARCTNPQHTSTRRITQRAFRRYCSRCCGPYCPIILGVH